MKKYIKIPALIFLITSMWSCTKTPLCDCFDSAGSPTEVTRSVPFFNQVYVKDNINVFISIGPTQQVTLQGGGNLLQNIGTDVSNNCLTLSNNNICNWLRSYKKSVLNVYITVPSFNYLTNAGVGTIQSLDTLNVDTFQVKINNAGDINLVVKSNQIQGHLFGSGDLTLSGSSQQFLSTYYGGTGYMYCSNLTTGYSYISNSSTGDSYVNASGLLIALIYGRGNIYYTGNPSITLTSVGSGQLIHE